MEASSSYSPFSLPCPLPHGSFSAWSCNFQHQLFRDFRGLGWGSPERTVCVGGVRLRFMPHRTQPISSHLNNLYLKEHFDLGLKKKERKTFLRFVPQI